MVLCHDRPTVRLDDPLADGQSEPSPRHSLVGSAEELVEYLLFDSRRDPRTMIDDLDGDELPLAACANFDGSLSWRILIRILQQVHKELFKEHRIDIDEWHVIVDLHEDRTLLKALFETSQRRTDDFVQRYPVALEQNTPRLQPRHVQ